MFLRGYTLVQMSKHEQAVAEASRALSDDPLYTKAYERRAASLYDTGEFARTSRVLRNMCAMRQPARHVGVAPRVHRSKNPVPPC